MDTNNLATILELRATGAEDYICFLDAETGSATTYWQLRLCGVWLARELEAQGVLRGGWCAVDMDNCPAFFYTLAAAIYGGFSLVVLNARLTEPEKLARVDEIKRTQHIDRLPIIDEGTALSLVQAAHGAGQGALNLVAQWAHRGVGAFDEDAVAVVMFTSGTSGTPKVAPLTYKQLMGSAAASNDRLSTPGEGIWQLVLPAYHVGGLQVFFRSVLNHNAFILYRFFDPQRILDDAYTYGATHISVVDKMLQDLLAVDKGAAAAGVVDAPADVAPDAPTADFEAGDTAQAADGSEPADQAADNPADGSEPADRGYATLADYQCILLGGARPNRTTLIKALGAGAAVHVSYGMTETASQVACTQVHDPESWLLAPLPGYDLAVINPDEAGYGQLAVRGPGVFGGYLNAQTAFTADGFFLTGDRACMVGNRVEVAEREGDMFISGGENVYPAEICDKLLALEGVTDAHVFGAANETWGRRPVAFVEAADMAVRPGFNAFYFADEMRNMLANRLSPLYMPDQFVVMDAFPRTSVGKVAVPTLQRAWDQRIQVQKVELWQVRLPLVEPIRTAKTKMKDRASLLVRVTDGEGRSGIGECVAFETPWYMEETLGQDVPFIRDALAPLVVGRVLLRPEHALDLFENVPGAAQHPLACAAVETALWDLYGKVRKRSIRQLIGARDTVAEQGALVDIPAGCVPGGVVVGIGNVATTLAAVKDAVDAGYSRVKLKIKPGNDEAVVKAVREAFPAVQLMLDANQSYKDEDLDLFKYLDDFDIACVEEPFDPAHVPTVGPRDVFDRLTRAQANLRMRVCLDESWTTAEDLYAALEAHPELRCVSIKVGKFGSLTEALRFYAWARDRGIEVWPGGMYDTGVSKRLHAALALLPGVNFTGDISDSARYFTVDVCDPPFAMPGGVLQVNDSAHPYGLGCDLNDQAVASITEASWVVE